MKNQSIHILGAALAIWTLNACTNEVPDSVQKELYESSLECVFSAKSFVRDFNDASRTAISPEAESASFSWTEGDIIGVLPDEGAQVYFTIKDIAPENADKATFTGGAWGLKAENNYAAYYPFIEDIRLDRKKVPVDYTGQVHKGVIKAGQTSIKTLAAYDYMAAKSIKQESGNLNFQFNHLGALVEVKFKLPTPGPVNRLVLTSTEAVIPVKGTFDLTASTVAITSTAEDKAYSFTVEVEELKTTENNQEVSVFFMMPPMAGVKTNTLGANVFYGEDNLSLSLKIKTEKTLEAGKYYTLETEVNNEYPEYIEIADDGSGFITNNPIREALRSLGGTKLRFVSQSSLVSENVVFTDADGIKAYATRNGDWLEIHTIAKKYKLPEHSNGLFYSIDDSELNISIFSKLTEIDIRQFDTSEVKNMSRMFASCYSLTSLDLSNFNTSHVTDMSRMFYGSGYLTSLDLSNFDTSHVTDMSAMFIGCGRLVSLDLKNFNTSKVHEMEEMFASCSALASLDLSHFNTSEVTNMSSMFKGCSKLTSLDLSNFDTSIVNDMSSMFNGCSDLTSLDLSSFVFDSGYTQAANCEWMFSYAFLGGGKIYVSSNGKAYLEKVGAQKIGLNSRTTLEVK